jgi:AcrR family transcriptional regulator
LDGRIKYTQHIIRKSFIEILEVTPLEKVTVKEICEKADSNRGTFYKYFSDPYDLIEKISDEIFDKILFASDKFKLSLPLEDFLTDILATISENKDYWNVILNQYGLDYLLNRFVVLFHDKVMVIVKEATPDIDEKAAENQFLFYMSGSLAVIKSWIKNGCKESEEYILDFLKHVLSWQSISG